MLRNKCQFRGNLVRDPELRSLKNDNSVANFTIAVNGYKKGDVVYPDCVVWGDRAVSLCENCSKGDCIEVEGTFFIDNYEKDGEKYYRPKFTIHDIEFIKLKKWGQGVSAQEEQPNNNEDKNTNVEEEDDDDTPF